MSRAVRVVAIDATPLEARAPGGVARLVGLAVRVARGLAERRLVVSRRPLDLDRAFGVAGDPARDPGVENLVVGGSGPIALWRERSLPGALEREGVQLFHSATTAVPLRGSFAVVATVHELAWRRSPGSEPAWRGMRQRWRLRTLGGRVGAVMVPSEATRDDLAAWAPGLAERVRVVRPCVAAAFEPTQRGSERDRRDREIRASLGLDGAYFVVVGAPRRKKDVGVACAALARITPSGERRPGLVVVGDTRGRASRRARRAIEREASRVGVAERLRWAGRLADEETAAVIRGATALVHPSRSEGFGFPPLEAMACGVPVVAARAGSIPEVTGDAALLVEAGDASALAAAMESVSGESAAAREERTRRALRRAASFTRERFAQDLATLWSEASGGPGSDGSSRSRGR